MKFDLKSSDRHIARLKNIAKVISGMPGIDVVIHPTAKGPYYLSDKKICVMPNGDYSDPEFITLIEGFICHEPGHARYTNCIAWDDVVFNALRQADGYISDSKGSFVFSSPKLHRQADIKARRLGGLVNLFDDVQMEFQTGRDYAQAQIRLADTYALLVKKGKITNDITVEDPNPVQFIEMYLLNKLRNTVLGQVGDREILDAFYDYCERILQPVLPELNAIYEEACDCRSTEGAIDLAYKTYELMQRLRDEAKQQQQQEEEQPESNSDSSSDPNESEPGSDNSSNGNGSAADDGDSESDTDGGNKSGAGSEDDVQSDDDSNGSGKDKSDDDSADGNNSTDESGSETDENAATGDDGQPVEKSNFTEKDWEKLSNLLDDFLNSDDESTDYHKLLANIIAQSSADCSDEVKAEFGGANWDVPDLHIDMSVYNEVVNLSHSVSGDLSVLQHAKVRVRNKTRDRGIQFDNNRLIQSPMGVRDVFRTKSESKARGHIGLVIVRDISGSMSLDERYIHAIKTDLALSIALQSYPKMHVANIVYPTQFESSEVIKTFGQSVEECISRFSIGCKGGHTPTGDALISAVNLLIECQFDRKIILLITDGEPTMSDVSIGEALDIGEENGIEVAGIGINIREFKGFKEDTFINVEDVNMLSSEVRRLVYQILAN